MILSIDPGRNTGIFIPELKYGIQINLQKDANVNELILFCNHFFGNIVPIHEEVTIIYDDTYIPKNMIAQQVRYLIIGGFIGLFAGLLDGVIPVPMSKVYSFFGIKGKNKKEVLHAKICAEASADMSALYLAKVTSCDCYGISIVKRVSSCDSYGDVLDAWALYRCLRGTHGHDSLKTDGR